MTSAPTVEWQEANQRYSMGALAEVRHAIERMVLPSEECSDDSPAEDSEAGDLRLQTLCRTFELSAFERKILVMCAGVEWDSRFAGLCADAQGGDRRTGATFSLALAAFDDAHWSALSPARPLRHWRLVRVGSGDSVTASPLRIDERVLHFLAGVDCLDEELRPLAQPIPSPSCLPASHREVANEIARTWSGRRGESSLPVVQLSGDETFGKRVVAASAVGKLGLVLHAMDVRQIPADGTARDTFRRLWEREAILSSTALLLECDEGRGEAQAEDAATWLMEHVRSPLLVATRSPRRCAFRQQALFEIKKPTAGEQSEIWHGALPDELAESNGIVPALVSQFSLGTAAIFSVANETQRDVRSGEEVSARVWDACRIHSRPSLESLAQRIEGVAGWDDLVLPDKQRELLRQIVLHVRHRARVYGEWGFAGRSSGGLGISALFAGPSGTGKTMAAEVLANELRLDLYRIDLSQIVNKYIGETEKNLGRVFDAADEGAAILLFDEADALFGKRSEVKDSHDRYANIEVSYLLQRMEEYRGLAILTTNRKSALDQAFLRRIRFVVEFPFPDFAERLEIWRRVFPTATPTEGLSIERLARLNASGAHIRNIAMGAAFLAADAGTRVRMSHLLAAARQEFMKLEKPIMDAEIAGWM